MFLLNDSPINIYKDLVVGDGDDAITYPAVSLQNAAIRVALGIVEVPDQVRPDDRFYFVTENADGTYTAEPKSLDSVVSMLWEDIKKIRDSLQESGCPVGSDWFHNDVKSRTQWERMANRAIGMLDSDPYMIGENQVQWKAIGGTFIPLTAGKIKEVVAAFEARESEIFLAAETHLSNMKALTTVEELAAYDFRANWPNQYIAAN